MVTGATPASEWESAPSGRTSSLTSTITGSKSGVTPDLKDSALRPALIGFVSFMLPPNPLLLLTSPGTAERSSGTPRQTSSNALAGQWVESTWTPRPAPKQTRLSRRRTSYAEADDGLAHDWAGRVWLNPPFKSPLVRQFIEKLLDSPSITAAVVVTNNATETRWGQKLLQAATRVCLPSKRIRFLRPDGTPGTPFARANGLRSRGRPRLRCCFLGPGNIVWGTEAEDSCH